MCGIRYKEEANTKRRQTAGIKWTHLLVISSPKARCRFRCGAQPICGAAPARWGSGQQGWYFQAGQGDGKVCCGVGGGVPCHV